DPDVVNRHLGLLFNPGGILHQAHDRECRQQADRNVDEEDPTPTETIGDPTAHGGPQHGRHDGCDGGEGKSAAALRRRKRVENDRLLVRLQTATEKSLQHSKNDQFKQIIRDSAQERARCECEDADNEVALATQQPCEKRRYGQHDAVSDEIRGQSPRGFIVTDGQGSGDMRQGDIDDGRIEHFHECGQRDGHCDQPRIACRLPTPLVPRSCLLSHGKYTTGDTDKPMGSGRSGSSPRSMTILTGTRWTILTKLPVAFSAGKAENRAPLPYWMLCTCPSSLYPR